MYSMVDRAAEAKRIFASGENVEVSQDRLKHEYNLSIFPCGLYQSVTGNKVLIAVCYKSRKGDNYGVNEQLLLHLRSVKDNGRANQCKVAFVTSDDPKNQSIDYLDGMITVDQQLEKLDGIVPMKGNWGNYFWVDSGGNPTRGGPAPDVPGDVYL
jgi:hypothetical protein